MQMRLCPDGKDVLLSYRLSFMKVLKTLSPLEHVLTWQLLINCLKILDFFLKKNHIKQASIA